MSRKHHAQRKGGTSRAQRQLELLAAAHAVQTPGDCDVTVVGGGASGLVAAIVAAEEGASVVVLEQELECGRTILATGGGRCNFANLDLLPSRYNDPAFVSAVCGAHWLDDVLDFFRACGLRWCSEEDRLYPLSRTSASVRNVLLARAHAAGVVLACGRRFCDVSWIKPEWVGALDPAIHYRPNICTQMPGGIAEIAHTLPPSVDGGAGEEGPLILPGSRTVILANGGGDASESLLKLGLRLNKAEPVLCPLACEPSPLMTLDGRRAHVVARLTHRGTNSPCYEEAGEVLFRSYGLSGIVTFDLSRRAAPGDLIELDLAPQVPPHELRTLADPTGSGAISDGALDGVLDPTIATTIVQLARKGWHVSPRSAKQGTTPADSVIELVKGLPFVVKGPAEPERAQVTRGGLATEQFDPATLSSREHPWLYACGEALDVDGDCGGFNLAWAWKSGLVAGRAAARWALAR